MDKRQKRTQTKRERIKRTALEQFAAHGVDKVSMDEIAEAANVSKVTIYKYFGSKEALYAEVINVFIDDTLAATESILASDMDFLEKLKSVMRLQADSSRITSGTYLFEMWEKDPQLHKDLNESLQSKVKALMYRFFEEGRQQGYIDEMLSFDLLYLYSDIFQAGFRARGADLEVVFADKETFTQLVNLFFFGIIRQKTTD